MKLIASSNRRSFLQNTAGAASALILPSGLLRGREARKLNIGFIGMGGFARQAVDILIDTMLVCWIESQRADASWSSSGA